MINDLFDIILIDIMSHIEYRIIMKAQISQPGGADGGEWQQGALCPLITLSTCFSVHALVGIPSIYQLSILSDGPRGNASE